MKNRIGLNSRFDVNSSYKERIHYIWNKFTRIGSRVKEIDTLELTMKLRFYSN